LLAPLVQLLQCLVSCVFFFHDLNMGAITRNSRLQWAESIGAFSLDILARCAHPAAQAVADLEGAGVGAVLSRA